MRKRKKQPKLSLYSPEFDEYAHTHYEYLPEQGITVHRKSGKRAGSLDKNHGTQAYWRLHFSRFGSVYEHRFAMWWMTGKWPEKPMQVDHKDRQENGPNNKWSNLRVITPAQQQWNTTVPADRTIGVYPRGKRWIGELRGQGFERQRASFPTENEARAFRLQAQDEYRVW